MRRLFLISFFVGGLVVCPAVVAETNVSGSQFGTWDLAGSPYILTGDITIPEKEPFSDWGADGTPNTFDTGEGDAQYTLGEPYTDWNGNSSYDDPLILMIEPGVEVQTSSSSYEIRTYGTLVANGANLS
ncbi:MAG: hypothetical protein KAY65_15805, partial [Planctomycetes bacterium]|nr:hypothetical protein [Planctomycetota bacterium]